MDCLTVTTTFSNLRLLTVSRMSRPDANCDDGGQGKEGIVWWSVGHASVYLPKALLSTSSQDP
jgi:hypothetical protein